MIGTIQAVGTPRDWTGNYGPMRDYPLQLDTNGNVMEVYITQKPETPAPQAGQSIDYEIARSDQHGTKIKRAQQQQGQGNFPATTTTAPPANGSPAQADPRQKSIERQTAAKVAGMILNGASEAAAFDELAAQVLRFIQGAQPQPAAAPAAAQPQDAGPPAEDTDVPF